MLWFSFPGSGWHPLKGPGRYFWHSKWFVRFCKWLTMCESNTVASKQQVRALNLILWIWKIYIFFFLSSPFSIFWLVLPPCSSLSCRQLCNGITKTGKACKKRALPGQEYCRVHEGGHTSHVHSWKTQSCLLQFLDILIKTLVSSYCDVTISWYAWMLFAMSCAFRFTLWYIFVFLFPCFKCLLLS